MTVEELAREIARGLIATGVEGGYNSISCSTAGDYPSIGCSQWEGGRADNLLSQIPGGDHFANRAYSDIEESGELEDLAELLGSPEGQTAQLNQLAKDCEMYVEELQQIASLDDSRCLIYCGMWCPTSHYVVKRFLQNRESDYNLRDIDVLHTLFRYDYAAAAGCEEYWHGYANRADVTYWYATEVDLTTPYGVPPYEKEE